MGLGLTFFEELLGKGEEEFDGFDNVKNVCSIHSASFAVRRVLVMRGDESGSRMEVLPFGGGPGAGLPRWG